MLLRFREALEQGALSVSYEGFDSRLLLFPPAFNSAMRELDRCLDEMRLLASLRWHTIAFYVDIDWVQKPIMVKKASKQGWTLQVSGYRLEPRRAIAASEQKANDGVRWLASEYHWDRIHLKALNEACGAIAA